MFLCPISLFPRRNSTQNRVFLQRNSIGGTSCRTYARAACVKDNGSPPPSCQGARQRSRTGGHGGWPGRVRTAARASATALRSGRARSCLCTHHRTIHNEILTLQMASWRDGTFPLPSCSCVLAMALPWECGTMPRRPVGRGMLVLCWCSGVCNSHDQTSRWRMTSPSTGWMATGSRTVTHFVSFVGEGPTKMFPGGQLPTMTPSLLMGRILCLQQISATSAAGTALLLVQ